MGGCGPHCGHGRWLYCHHVFGRALPGNSCSKLSARWRQVRNRSPLQDRTHLRAPRSADPITLDSPATVTCLRRIAAAADYPFKRSGRRARCKSEERGITLQPQVRPCFTIPDVWSGGYYELELYLGPPSEANIRAALHAVWQHPALEGPFADRDKEPSDQAIVATDAETEHYGLFGFTQIGGVRIPCETFVVNKPV
jgi:hypothetical protein